MPRAGAVPRSWRRCGASELCGVVRGAGRRGSVACGVAQRALLCAFMFLLMSFLYFRSYFRCILAFFVFVYLCAAVCGVIKNNNNNVCVCVCVFVIMQAVLLHPSEELSD